VVEMRLSDDVFTVFTAEIESKDGTPVVEIPDRELEVGDLAAGDTYRVALLPRVSGLGAEKRDAAADQQRSSGGSSPPVDEGDTLDVEIEDVGDQGDGIARIGPGYIVFVSDTDVGDRVTIEITESRENFAFADVIDPEPLSG